MTMGPARGSTVLFLLCCLCFIAYTSAQQQCKMEDWSVKFSKKGFSSCSTSDGYYYISGFERSDSDSLMGITKAKCCRRDQTFWNLPTQCQMPNWVDTMGTSGWSLCQPGFFLRGLYRGANDNIGNIEWGKCCKPSHHPYTTGECYNEDVSNTFNKAGVSECKKEGHFIAGFETTAGDNKLSNIVKFKCCKMAPEIPQLTSLKELKERVMDTTMTFIGQLASYLGFSWAGGCWAQYNGEDFQRKGDTWESRFREPCLGDGPKKNVRLKISFGDFSFGMKEIDFGESVTQSFSLDQEQFLTTYSRIGRNTRNVAFKPKVELESRNARTVKNVKTTSWDSKFGVEAGLEYSPPSVTGGVGFSAKTNFKYEWGGDEEDSDAQEDWHIFKITETKELPPKSFAEWQAIKKPQKVTIPYTAKIVPKFSVVLEGYMRWGGGYDGDNPNFHEKHRGAEERPTVKHTFGSAEKPFYEALKEQSEENMHPWQWHAMKQRHPWAQNLLDLLTDEDLYTFTMTGQFEESTEYEIKSWWSESKPIEKVQDAERKLADQANQPQKPPEFPPIRPPPPNVTTVDNSKEIKPPPQEDMEAASSDTELDAQVEEGGKKPPEFPPIRPPPPNVTVVDNSEEMKPPPQNDIIGIL